MIKPIRAFLILIAFLSGSTAYSYAQNLNLEEREGAVPPREMIDYPTVKLRALDKVSARTLNFESNVGSTFKFGSLYIKIQACRKTPHLEKPEAASFLQIWEVTPQDEAEWIFSGWMFSSSPALSFMDHPIYDVWVLDCIDPSENLTETPEDQDIASDEKKEGEGEVEESQIPDQPNIEAEILE